MSLHDSLGFKSYRCIIDLFKSLSCCTELNLVYFENRVPYFFDDYLIIQGNSLV